MITVAIVEDSADHADILHKKIMETDFKDEVSVDIYLSPATFLSDLNKGKRYQICFSDIKMPEMNGIKLAEQIRRKDSRMLLIFLSSYLEYALEGYQVNAFDYLLKGRVDDKWDKLVGRILKRLENDRKKVYKVITQNKVEIIPLDSIVYIYKEGKYCNFVLENQKEKVAFRKTIKEIWEELHGHKNFIQIKRGYIANIDKIQKCTSEELVMTNEERLVIGRMHISRVKDLIMAYVREL